MPRSRLTVAVAGRLSFHPGGVMCGSLGLGSIAGAGQRCGSWDLGLCTWERSRFMAELRFGDRGDFEDADRGFIARLDPGIVRSGDGRVVWDGDAYGFL